MYFFSQSRIVFFWIIQTYQKKNQRTVEPKINIHQYLIFQQNVLLKKSVNYCSRYCDICGLSEKIESHLNKEGYEFLPELANGNEEKFAPKCTQISANTYEFKRTINLPGRKHLEAKVREKMQGLDGEIRKRLNKGVPFRLFYCFSWNFQIRGIWTNVDNWW